MICWLNIILKTTLTEFWLYISIYIFIFKRTHFGEKCETIQTLNVKKILSLKKLSFFKSDFVF